MKDKFARAECGVVHLMAKVFCNRKVFFFDFLFVCHCGKDFDVTAHHAKILQAETLHRPKICGSKTKPNYTEYDLDLVSSQFHRTEWTSASA